MREQLIAFHFCGNRCLRWRVKHPYVIPATTMNDPCHEPTSSFVESDTTEPTCVVTVQFLVFQILLSGCAAEIGKPVVLSIPISMVNVELRPLPDHVEPDQPVLQITYPFNLDRAITVGTVFTTCSSTDAVQSPTFHLPSEHTRLRVVIQQFPQTFLSQHHSSPVTFTKRCRVSVASTGNPQQHRPGETHITTATASSAQRTQASAVPLVH